MKHILYSGLEVTIGTKTIIYVTIKHLYRDTVYTLYRDTVYIFMCRQYDRMTILVYLVWDTFKLGLEVLVVASNNEKYL